MASSNSQLYPNIASSDDRAVPERRISKTLRLPRTSSYSFGTVANVAQTARSLLPFLGRLTGAALAVYAVAKAVNYLILYRHTWLNSATLFKEYALPFSFGIELFRRSLPFKTLSARITSASSTSHASQENEFQNFDGISFVEAFLQCNASWHALQQKYGDVHIIDKIQSELDGCVWNYPHISQPLTFDQVWQLYNDTSKRPNLLQEMVSYGAIDVRHLHTLASQDLQKSLALSANFAASSSSLPLERQNNSPSAPEMIEADAPSSPQIFTNWPSDTSGVARTLLHRMTQYGEFIVTHLGVPVEMVRDALALDPEVQKLTFLQLRDCMTANQCAKFISAEMMKQKAAIYVADPTTTWQQLYDQFGRDMFEHFTAQSIYAIFDRDCIQSLCAMDLIKKWYTWPICEHGMGLNAERHRLLSNLRYTWTSCVPSSTHVDDPYWHTTVSRTISEINYTWSQSFRVVRNNQHDSAKD